MYPCNNPSGRRPHHNPRDYSRYDRNPAAGLTYEEMVRYHHPNLQGPVPDFNPPGSKVCSVSLRAISQDGRLLFATRRLSSHYGSDLYRYVRRIPARPVFGLGRRVTQLDPQNSTTY